MSGLRNRKTENWIYLSLWVITIGLYVLDMVCGRAEMSLPLFDVCMVTRALKTILPFVILFVINNNLLIPGLLLRNKVQWYFFAAGALVLVMCCFQYVGFKSFLNSIPAEMRGGPRHHRPEPLLPMPLLLDFTYSLLVIGANMAIALLFQRFDDKLEKESLRKANAENELAYLKAQINPHFYMNMLNNIHGMIEIDPAKAQAMVIDMSKLMRYMLYDSSRTRIPLANEISFLHNYLRIMRRRYPEDKVSITDSFPAADAVAGVEVPPLLTLVFVENAFKHGISYRSHSYVAVSMTLAGGELSFSCINSRHTGGDSVDDKGIGLRNIRQRLALLYGDAASMSIRETETDYIVNLTIPVTKTDSI